MAWVHNLHEHDPDSKIPRVIAICVVFPTVAFLAVGLRMSIRMSTKRTPWVDDYAVLVSVLLSIVYAGLVISQTRWGLGLSQEYFPMQNAVQFSKIQWIGGPVYTLNLLAFKLALLASYFRIGGFVKSYRTTIIVATTICVATQVIFTLIISLACRPIARQWNLAVEGKCIDTVSFYYALAGTNLGFDIVIIILPLPVLWNLQLHRKQKIVLTGMFALGFFVTIIQIIRIFSVKNLKSVTDSQGLIVWSVVEVSLGAIITCIPTFGPLFKSFASTISSYRNNGTGPSYPLDSIPKGGARNIKSDIDNTATFGSQNEATGMTVRPQQRGGLSVSHDTGSEEHILHGGDDGMRIYKTVDFTVEKY